MKRIMQTPRPADTRLPPSLMEKDDPCVSGCARRVQPGPLLDGGLCCVHRWARTDTCCVTHPRTRRPASVPLFFGNWVPHRRG